MFKLTRAKYMEALESAEEMQTALETEMENIGISCEVLSNNWFGQQSENTLSMMCNSLRDGNYRKAYAYTKGMAQVMGEYLPEIEKMMAKREQIGKQLHQDEYYEPDLSTFSEEQLIINYEYIDDIKADAEGAVLYAEKAAEILEEMIETVEETASDYVDLSKVKELLEEGKNEIKRIENYRDEFVDFGKKMSDLEYNMSYDLSAIMLEQGDTTIIDNPVVMIELDLIERTQQMEDLDYHTLLQKDEAGNYLFEELLNKSLDELTEEEIEILAQIYAEAYGKLSGTENEQESAEIVICFTENLFELTEETDGIAEHYYVKSKNELIRAIEEKIDKEQELAIYSLENLWGTRIQLNWLWYESDWSEFTTDIPELKDFQENSELMSVVLVKTDLGIQTILYASPYAGNRENYADKGYKVIYEKELYDLPLVERCIRTGYVMTMEEEKQIEKEVKEYFSKDENKLAMDMALTFGIDNITQSTKVNYTEAEMEEFQKMYYLYWKTNDVEAIAYGFYSNFILTKPLVYGGLEDHLTGYREDGSHEREYLEIAVEQNKFSYATGSIIGGLLSYKAGASIMKKIPGVGKVFTKAGEKLSKLPIIGKFGAESLTDILADTTLDTAIDTIPCMVEMAMEGESGGEIVKEGIKQTVSNIGTNVAFEAVFKIGKEVAKGIKKGGQEVLEEGAEAAIKGGFKSALNEFDAQGYDDFLHRTDGMFTSEQDAQKAFQQLLDRDFKGFAKNFDFSTKPDTAYFWSGDKVFADNIAKSNGGTIMESTPGGQVVDNWDWLEKKYPSSNWGTGNDLDPQPLWRAVSKEYANGVSGKVTYVNQSYEGKVWLYDESPIVDKLMDKGIVSSVDYYNKEYLINKILSEGEKGW